MKLRPRASRNAGPVLRVANRTAMSFFSNFRKQRTKLNRKLRSPISPIRLPSLKDEKLPDKAKDEEVPEADYSASTCTHLLDDLSYGCEDIVSCSSARKRPRGDGEVNGAGLTRRINDNEVEASETSSCLEEYYPDGVKTKAADDSVSFASNSVAEKSFSCLSSLKMVKDANQVSLEASTKNAINDVISDLACEEKLGSSDDEDDDVVSDYYGFLNEECDNSKDNNGDYCSSSCTVESSDFSVSTLFLSTDSEFSEKSAGEDSFSSPTFSLLIQFRNQFTRSSCFPSRSNALYRTELNFVRFEDEEEEESYGRLRERERKHAMCYDFSEVYRSATDHGDLIVEQRSLMVHWIAEHSWELQPETMFLAVSLLDRFLSKGFFTSTRKLQIVGIACLALATRIEENQPYNSVKKKQFSVGSEVYSRCEVVAMEWLVQEVLNFQCFFPTIYNFLGFYIKAAGADKEVEKRAKYLAVLAIADHEQLGHWPSTVAASLVILASLESNHLSTHQRVIEVHVRTKDNDLHECIKNLEWLLQFAC